MSGAGDFRTRLLLQKQDDVPDGQSGTQRNLSDVGKVWARVTPLNARERVEADSAGATLRVRIEVRAPFDVTLAHQFVDGETVYRVTGYRADDRIVTIDAEVRVI